MEKKSPLRRQVAELRRLAEAVIEAEVLVERAARFEEEHPEGETLREYTAERVERIARGTAALRAPLKRVVERLYAADDVAVASPAGGGE